MAKAKPNYKEFVEGQLECSVCLETVRDPQTLQGCFHSFCSTCLDRLLQKEGGLDAGVTCPICRKFSRRDDIQANFFIKNLADMHLAHTERRSCEQCPEGTVDASSKCLDCKVLLCESCKDGHLKIKLLQNHRVLPLSEDTEIIVDLLVFCSQHPDKPIELYCEPCNSAVCMMCTVIDHSGHKCQTIQATLDRMVPQWEKNISIIDEKMAVINKSFEEVDKKIEETKSEFDHCADEIDKKTEQRIAEIRNTQNTMKQELRARETEEVEKLEGVRRSLEEKRRDGENVRRVVRTSLDRARHASLLAELLQEGLGSRVRELVEWRAEVIGSIRVSLPTVQRGDTVWEEVREGMLGRVVYQAAGVLRAVSSVVAAEFPAGSRQWNVGLQEYFSRKFRQAKEIRLPGECSRFAVIGEHIWAPVRGNGVQVFDKTGKLVKKFEQLKHPKAVNVASNGDIFVAGRQGSGLYQVTGLEFCDLHKICEGSILDVGTQGHTIYALHWKPYCIHKYTCSIEMIDQNRKKSWTLEKTIDIHLHSTSDTFLVHQPDPKEPVKFYVCTHSKNIVSEFNEEGKCSRNFEGIRKDAHICGIDKQANLLIASSTGLQAVDTTTGKITDLGTLGLDSVSQICDARLDNGGSVWVLYRNKWNNFISKQEPE